MPLIRSAVLLASTLGLTGCIALTDPASVDPAAAPIAADPSTFESNELDRLGRQDLDEGNNGLAAEHLRGAVNKNRNDATAWIGLAAAYDNLGRFDLADAAYAQVVRLQGETRAVLNNRGYSFFLRGDREQALANLTRAATLFPGDATIQNNIQLVRSGELPNRRAAP